MPQFDFEQSKTTLLYRKTAPESGRNALISLKKMNGIAKEMEVSI
jgi:hypothetical protein